MTICLRKSARISKRNVAHQSYQVKVYLKDFQTYYIYWEAGLQTIHAVLVNNIEHDLKKMNRKLSWRHKSLPCVCRSYSNGAASAAADIIVQIGAGYSISNNPHHPCLLLFTDDFNFARKKKHPELAYRSHEFFDMSLALTSDSPDFAGERVRRLSVHSKLSRTWIIIVRDYFGVH